MKTGRLSYTLNDAGERRVDVAELQRVFGLRSGEGNGATPGNGAQPVKSHSAQHPAHQGEVAALRETIEVLRATVASQDATIRSIQDEKRALLALLTDQRARPWWRRWLR